MRLWSICVSVCVSMALWTCIIRDKIYLRVIIVFYGLCSINSGYFGSGSSVETFKPDLVSYGDVKAQNGSCETYLNSFEPY